MTKKGNEISALLAKAKSSTPANPALIAKIAATQEDFDQVKNDSAKRQDQLKKCLGDAQVGPREGERKERKDRRRNKKKEKDREFKFKFI